MVREVKNWVDITGFVLMALVLTSVFLFPSFSIGGLWFKIGCGDLLLPAILCYILFLMRPVLKSIYLVFPLIYITVILLSMLINRRLGVIQDYFEIYKVVKYATYLLFFTVVLSWKRIYNLFPWITLGLLSFNLLHYFDLFGFNEFIMPLYSSGPHLEFFGLNSLGEPATRRLLGTMGNPNVNAIALMFIFILYLVKQKKDIVDNLVLYTVFTLVIACQSRTAFIALILIYMLFLLVQRPKIRRTLIQLAVFISLIWMVGISDHFQLAYLQSVSHAELKETRSVQGRLEVWQHLGKMIKDKPIIGHGPYKEYFYENELYPESEYVLILWRYGLIGLFVFLLVYLFPLYQIAVRREWTQKLPLLLLSVLFGITALTNNPFSEPRTLLLFAFSIALWLNMSIEKPVVSNKSEGSEK